METLVKKIDARTTSIEARTTSIDARTTSIEARTTSIDARTTRIEQILPTLATRDEVNAVVHAEGERTRQHFNAVAERIEASVKVIAEGHEATKARVDAQRTEIETELAAHDRRIMKLEAESLKRR
jgi:chromosome segregation ATPase